MDFFNFCNPQFLVPFIVVACILAIGDMILKGFALWKAAKNNHSAWFVCLFIFNTAGILPIIYLLLNRTKKE